MKKKQWIQTTVIVFACIGLTVGAAIAAGTPGSADDPVVTKSYVDQKVAEASGSLYQSVNLAEGQSIYGGEGAEIILRTGGAIAIDNGENGVSDLTSGADLRTGAAVSPNHLLLIPRNDGRGITATTEAWFMVRGPYSIASPEGWAESTAADEAPEDEDPDETLDE